MILYLRTRLLALTLWAYHTHYHWRTYKDWLESATSIFAIPANRHLTIAYIAYAYYAGTVYGPLKDGNYVCRLGPPEVGQ